MAFDSENCLKFKALEDNCTISLPASQQDGSHYKFSKDGGTWVEDTITLNKNETCYVKGTNYPSAYPYLRSTFSISAPAEIISGNIMSLVDDGAGQLKKISKSEAFTSLFRYCSNLMSIPGCLLPATNLDEHDSIYAMMFADCSNLTSLPANLLPSLAVGRWAYQSMFSNCTGLVSIPENFLPATELDSYCYDTMFYRCSNLESIPKNLLPATTLETSCYSGMFEYCSKLSSPVYLPATTLASLCYEYMLTGCTSLKEIHVSFNSWGPPGNATENWVRNMSNSGDFYCPRGLTEEYGYNRIPTGWNIHFVPINGKAFSVNFLAKHKIGGRIK